MKTRGVALAFACYVAGCRSTTAPHVTNDEAAWCVPADTLVLAGIDLERVRAAPLFSKLPAAALAVVGSLSAASSAMLAYNGRELLAIARGNFAQPPPGAELASPRLALLGGPQQVAAAVAQHRTRAAGAPALMALADSAAKGEPLWVVARGGAPLPFTGNAENLNQVLRNAESITLTANLDSGLALAITAIGRTANSARTIEETLRAEITLAAAAEARHADLAKLLRSVQIDRSDRTVRIAVAADADAAAKLLAALGR